METTAHFDNIPQEIARRLAAAESEIVAAIAWFTDRELFDVLCRQTGRGVRVRLAVLGDRINLGPGGLNFQRLQDIGGELFVIPAAGDRDPIMHHKFCVIDGATVLVGSYNWTKRAQSNDENVTVLAGAPELAALEARDADTALALADRRAQIQGKALARIGSERYIEFFATHPDASHAFVTAVSGYFPFSESLIERHADILDRCATHAKNSQSRLNRDFIGLGLRPRCCGRSSLSAAQHQGRDLYQ